VLKTFSITDIGKKRKLNQDFVFTSELPIGPLPNLFVVADGMGGHNAGDLASKLSVETIVSYVENAKDASMVDCLKNAIIEANRELRDKAKEDERLVGMGTTMVVASCQGHSLLVANVGDSRLYIVNEMITQITRDHSLVEEMVQFGGIDRDSARTHPDKNVITRAIGAEDDVKIDFFQVNLKLGDVVLMCTDGLTNMLSDDEIRMILDGQRDIVEKAEELVKAANNNGGRDNIAVVLIEPYVEAMNDLTGRSI